MHGGGNGMMFRTRSENDARAFVEEMRARGGRHPRGRREVVVVLCVIAAALLVGGAFELLA